jgi:hypothetical protein
MPDGAACLTSPDHACDERDYEQYDEDPEQQPDGGTPTFDQQTRTCTQLFRLRFCCNLGYVGERSDTNVARLQNW